MQSRTRSAYASIRRLTTNSNLPTGIEGSLAVMAVTLQRDEGYSDPFRLNAYFESTERCNDAKGWRDVLEVGLNC
jgi:hypothetical protein